MITFDKDGYTIRVSGDWSDFFATQKELVLALNEAALNKVYLDSLYYLLSQMEIDKNALQQIAELQADRDTFAKNRNNETEDDSDDE
ncbi:MAG: hypothetical protein LBF01_00725 [Bacteroidales bacterium]|jgi:hypothetical protein|nr:hypothetical protein [Bacteroidales bacterium]